MDGAREWAAFGSDQLCAPLQWHQLMPASPNPWRRKEHALSPSRDARELWDQASIERLAVWNGKRIMVRARSVNLDKVGVGQGQKPNTYRIIKWNAKFLKLRHRDISSPGRRIAGAANKDFWSFHHRFFALRDISQCQMTNGLLLHPKRAFWRERGNLEWLMTILIGSGTEMKREFF